MFFSKYIIVLWLLLCLEFVSVLCRTRNRSARGASCQPPESVQNAALKSKYGDIETFPDTDTVEYKCNIGYSIEGKSRKRRCDNGQWSNVKFKCTLILCTYVARPEHGKRLDANNGAGQFTHFECNVGYKMNGPSRILCRTDGHWNPSKPPTCNPILCPDLPNIQHGSIFQDTSDGIRNNYGSVSEYTCKRGYLLYGNPRKQQKYTRECRVDGTWSGEEPFCDIPKCLHIRPFYGGELVYFGERKRWSQAFYSCDDDFSKVPNNVDSSECTSDLEWVPAPPRCYKKAQVKKPANSYTRGTKDILLHGETYRLYCYSNYELFRDGFLEQQFEQITNNNGTLYPEVPKCEEERCDPADQLKAILEYEDGSKVTSKISSRTKVKLTCKSGYDYYRDGKPLNKPVMRKCEKGTIKRAPVCEEARCLFSGYPSNRNTYHRKHRDGRNYVVRDQYIYAREKIEVICRNKEDYELYVNSTETYLDTFSSECKFGQFDDAKGFPICLEKRCHFKPDRTVCLSTSDKGKCENEDFKVQSGTTVSIQCREGYTLYRSEDGSSVEANNNTSITCSKGTYFQGFKCIPDPCLVPKIPFGFAKSVEFGDKLSGEVEHGKQIEVICKNKEEYELYVNSTETYLETFRSECKFGQFNDVKSFPICLEKRCHFEPDRTVCLSTSDKGKCEKEDFKVQSGTTVSIQCREGYTLYRSADGSSVQANSSTSIICSKGTYFQGFKCIPDSLVEEIIEYAEEKLQQVDKVIDRFTCRFSIFVFRACSDPCLVPKIRFGFAKAVNSDDKISGEVEHETQVTVQCGDGYDLSKQMTTTCKFGEWDIDRYPFCSPKSCQLFLKNGTYFWVDSKLLTADHGTQKTIENGTKLDIKCANGYEMKNLKNEAKVKNVRRDSTCVLGTWTHEYSCEPEPCSVPVVHDASIRTKATESYKHDDKIVFECDAGHHFVGSSTTNEIKKFMSVCKLGNWSNDIPTGCQPDSCKLSTLEGSRYYLANGSEEITTTRWIEHDANVLLQCMDNFDVFGKDNIIVKETNSSPGATCYQGQWVNVHHCKKQCVIYNVTNGYVVRTGENITAGETVAHNENVTVTCENYKDLSITCNHGHWSGFTDCVGESNIAITETTIEPENESTTPYAAKTTEISNKDSTVTDKNHHVKDQVKECMLSSDKKYTYKDDRGVTIPQGSVISSGTTLTVTCTTIDYYELYTGYDDYSDETTDPTVTCTGNELSNIDLYCPEVQLATCMKLQDGNVKRSISSTYYVSCDEGFSLNLIFPEQNECICKDGVLTSVVGNQKPACIPDNCVLPFEIYFRMSVFNKYRVSLSGGSTVNNGDYVYFDCLKVDEQKYEPLNRRFRCLKGQWLEDEKDPNWKFGNNGTFPTCREAICKPVCENGGVCYKDNSCKCKPLTTGDQCEKVLCNDQCIENGGTCTASGNCSCPAGRFGNNCERKGCILPEHSAIPKNPKIMYQAGQELRQSDFESKHGYRLSSSAGMTCQDDGTWSDIVHYIKAVVYLIRVKTVTNKWEGAGTDARVYIYLHGVKGKTDKIYLTGSFESGDLDESRREAKDIRPITRVEIGHDGGGIGPGWNLEYASIYVENINEYYVFRQNEPVWVYQRDNVVLPIHGNCISVFDEGHTWYPKWDKLRLSDTSYIGKGSTMSRRECQQRCTELTDLVCKSVYYHRDTHVCWGLAVSHVSYFTVKKGSWNSHVHIRFCKEE